MPKISDLHQKTIIELGWIYFRLYGDLPIMEKSDIIKKILLKLKEMGYEEKKRDLT